MQRLDHESCERIFERLDDYLDRELSSDEIASVEAHLEQCAMCAAEYRFESVVIAQIRTKLKHLKAPPELLQRIASTLAAGDDSTG